MEVNRMSLLRKNRLGLIAAAVLVLAALGYYLWSQLQLADPAARVRREYARSQVEHRPLPVHPPLSPHGASPTVPLPTVPLQVQTSRQGMIESVLPADIAQANVRKPAELLPAVQPPLSPLTKRLPDVFLAHEDVAPFSPPVPQRMLDQTPPGDLPHEEPVAPVFAQLRVAPRRYFFDNRAPSALQGKAVQIRPEELPDFDPECFAPMGEDIVLALMNNVASNSFEVPVAAGVWEPFYFQGHRLLQVGDRLLGHAQAGKNRDRVLVTFDHIVFKDGRSLPVQAVALDPDGTVGVKGLLVGQNLLQTLTPVLLQAVQGFAEAFEDRTETVSSGLLGTSATTTLGNDLGTRGLEAGRGAMDKISQIVAQDLEENRPYVLAMAGTTCRARLLLPLDTSVADYGK